MSKYRDKVRARGDSEYKVFHVCELPSFDPSMAECPACEDQRNRNLNDYEDVFEYDCACCTCCGHTDGCYERREQERLELLAGMPWVYRLIRWLRKR